MTAALQRPSSRGSRRRPANGLHGRVQRQQIALLAAAGKGVSSGVMPDVAAVAAELAKLDIVAMSIAAVFEHKDEFVLAAIERAHSPLSLIQTQTFFNSA